MVHLALGGPRIEQVQFTGLTGYVVHDPSGLPVILQTSNGVTTLYGSDRPSVLWLVVGGLMLAVGIYLAKSRAGG